MTYGVTSAGWESKSLETIDAEIKAQVLASISPNLNLSETSIDGQTIGASASQISQLWESGQELYSQRDPETAEDDALDQLLKLVVGPRLAATKSVALMTVTLVAGTYPAGSLIVYPSSNPDSRFANDSEIVTAGATLTGQSFSAETEGRVVANLGTLTQIASGIGLSSPTNPAAAATGHERETDAEYRIRWRDSLAASGSCTVDAIRAALLATTNVTHARVVENTTDTTDANGIPSRAIGAYVLGGTDAAVAATIWTEKACGIQTSGTTSVNHTDAQGTVQVVKLTRPSQILVYVIANVTVLTGQYPSGDAFTEVFSAVLHGRVLAGGTFEDGPNEHRGGVFQPGEDVIRAKMIAAILALPGTVDVTALTLGVAPFPAGVVNLVADLDEYYDINSSNITVNLTYVSAVP